jgi:hypothetical protein
MRQATTCREAADLYLAEKISVVMDRYFGLCGNRFVTGVT